MCFFELQIYGLIYGKSSEILCIYYTLGLYHEQSRPDRDNHVKILWNNIQKGR